MERSIVKIIEDKVVNLLNRKASSPNSKSRNIYITVTAREH